MQLLEERWAAAEANLALAFAICDPRHQRNLGKILSYLVPVQILRGAMPRREMLRKYGLAYFEPIVAALKKGDPVELEAALDAEQTRFIRVRDSVWPSLRVVCLAVLCGLMVTHLCPRGWRMCGE